jgi:phage repressor protein C with HTH and peptisase S24 domain
MFRLIMVTGDSLSPSYQEGDYVVVATIPFLLRRLKVGDTIVFHNDTYGLMIKRVEIVDNGQERIYVVGINPDSVDSRRFGPIERKSIQGKVIWHIPRQRV